MSTPEQYTDLAGFFDPPTFGQPLLPSTLTVTPVGMAGLVRFGAPTLLGGSRAYPAGKAGTIAFGQPNVRFTEFALPDGWPPERYAELPFHDAQRKLSEGQAERSVLAGDCGWHGASFDARRGAYGLAHPAGVFAALVGERVKVTAQEGGQSVYVLVVDHADVPDDLSLTRRAFMGVGMLTDDNAAVTVQIIGEPIAGLA